MEETVRAEVAPGVSLDGIRRSEKAGVPEKIEAEKSAGCEASIKKQIHTHTMNCTQLRLTYPPRWRGC